MKTKTMIIGIALMFQTLINASIAFGQFVTANDNDMAMGSGATGTLNTGCDLMEYGITDFFVAVWDANNNKSGILLDDYAGATDLDYFQYTDAQDPDVALISKSGNIYAIVSYYTTSTGSPGAVVAEIYNITLSSLILYSGPTVLFNNVNQPTAINVDGNRNGDFIIVFDKDSSGFQVPCYVSGYVPSTTPVYYSTTGQSLLSGTTYPTGGCTYPDVCIYDSAGTELIYVSYIDMQSLDIIVQEERWQNIDQAVQNINYTTFSTITPTINTANVTAPRIACANLNASRYELTVVYSDRYLIESWTNYGGGVPVQQILNDGTAGSVTDDISAAPNTGPVVTYDESSYDLTIAWNYDNTGPTYGSGGFHPGAAIPIALQLDYDGTVNGSEYMDVPASITGNEYAISICGRHSGLSQIGVAWFDFSDDIQYKEVASPPSDFRIATNLQIAIKSDALRVFDLQGKLLKVTKEKVNNFSEFLKSLNLQKGVYIIKGIENTTSPNQMYFVP